MPRQPARKEVPRWRRGKTAPQPAAVIQVRGRHARALTRELTAARPAGRGKEGTAAGGAPAVPGAWRFRRHLVPFAWLAGLTAASALRAAPHPLLCGLAASVAAPLLMVLFTRHLPDWTRRAADVAALFTSIWLPVLAVVPLRSCIAWLLLTWAPLAALWTRHYRWRAAPAAPAAGAPASDLVIWDKLAGKRRWAGRLGDLEPLPGGGRRYPILLDGAETHIGQVMAEPRAVAAAYDRPQTEAYAEPDPTGVESRGYLTILDGGTLETVREWDERGIGEDGTAVIGRFADGQPARVRFWVPRDGTRHSLIAGTSGAGKTALIDMLIWLALKGAVPVVPIILDPQNGQSLPQYQDKLLYAAGIGECVRMVRGLNAGMMDRSRRLASMTWDDDGHKARGMPFFDARLTGLPVVMPFTDEAPVLLSGDGNPRLAAEMIRLAGERAKLGRKTGMSEQLAAQVPSLGELGDQALRSMLVGGNVICLRTGDKVSAGMVGLQADPYALPKYFPSGEPTQGLGYVVSIDNRQAPFRSDLVPGRMRHEPVEVPQLEDGFREAMEAAMGGISPTASFPPPPARPPEPAAEPEAAEGRRCIDAVWLVLSERGGEMTRGEVIKWVSDLAQARGRKPWSIKAVGDALRDLAAGKDPARPVAKPRDGVYRAEARESGNVK